MVTVYIQNCLACNTTFSRSSRDQSSRKRKHLKNSFCSRKCHTNYGRVTVYCKHCNKPFSDKKFLNRKFCSKSCSAFYNSKYKTKGTRRSKLETWIEEKLKELYPNLEIHFNKKDTIGSELDIYIPSLKLAIELNGIFHYEPIYGKDKLNKIQNNDINKFQECQKLGISLCVIDTSSQKYFKEQTSKKFLDIIISVISQATASYQTEPRGGY